VTPTPTPPTPFVLTIPSPLGPLQLRAAAGALCGLYLPATRHPPPPVKVAGTFRVGDPSTAENDYGKFVAPDAGDREVLGEAAAQLEAYFAGRRRVFALPLRLEGTAFQRRVWEMLGEIPFGETWSYGQLARAVGRAGASRAVGAANGRNPISIIVPCHRVIGSDGSLTGYGGGEPAKRWLLEHEAAQRPLALGGRRVASAPALGHAIGDENGRAGSDTPSTATPGAR
jgi:methylated-DNA-[protein]-cysteine S-methyltransferase